MILAGDIGGTRTRLALFEAEGRGPAQVDGETFASREHGGLAEIVAKFLAGRPGRVSRACFGIAGPVRDGRCETTNLPWVVDARDLARDLRIESARLINDLEANAYGLAALRPEDFAVLHTGEPDPAGNAALIAAGTGLGEAGLFWDGRRHRPFATEGGHGDFAPRDDLEIDLLRYLKRDQGHVSWERVLSGPGLHAIYLFLRDGGHGDETPWVAERLRREDPAAVIATAAIEGRSALCGRALDLFVALYGAEAGNLALKVMATGGVYVGGGIAPRILARLKGSGFMDAFLDKGRMRPLLERMPVRIILNDAAALLGAARCAVLDEES
ncbi:MAG TPA: glucokinase [Candidatus Polarisedimenticolia bacterium]|nr:glucokinase [Candidatus Polarisedimenticolia bacterium]